MRIVRLANFVTTHTGGLRTALRNLGVPVLGWDTGTELDSVLAPLRKPPPAVRRLAGSGL